MIIAGQAITRPAPDAPGFGGPCAVSPDGQTPDSHGLVAEDNDSAGQEILLDIVEVVDDHTGNLVDTSADEAPDEDEGG
nr:hypothetical protein [Nocardioides luteus]